MCSPQIAGSAQGVLSMAQTITSFIGAQQAYSANRQAANLNFANKTNALNAENTQLSEQSSEDHVSNAIKSAQQYGRIASTAASLGLGLSTLSPYLGAAQANVGRTQAIEDLNTSAKRQNIVAQQTGAEQERVSTIISKAKPNLLNLALNLGTDAVGGTATFAQTGGKFGINPTSGAPAGL